MCIRDRYSTERLAITEVFLRANEDRLGKWLWLMWMIATYSCDDADDDDDDVTILMCTLQLTHASLIYRAEPET